MKIQFLGFLPITIIYISSALYLVFGENEDTLIVSSAIFIILSTTLVTVAFFWGMLGFI